LHGAPTGDRAELAAASPEGGQPIGTKGARSREARRDGGLCEFGRYLSGEGWDRSICGSARYLSGERLDRSIYTNEKGKLVIEGGYTILVAVECDATRTFVVDNLAADGYTTVAASSRERALVLLCERLPHLLVLDIDAQTLALLDAVRGGRGVAGRCCADVPIVVLSGQTGEPHRVRLLHRGADGVVEKPCSYPGLHAEIEALLRRAYGPARRPRVVRVGSMTIDPLGRTVDADGREIALTRIEFDVLVTLGRQLGRVFTKDELYRAVWRAERYHTRTLDSHIARLRAKLRAAGAEPLPVAVWGFGYRLGEAVARKADAA
jgi:two-component system, OmpR family, response regulator MtrA